MKKRLTSTSTITSKYQTVIPRQIREELGLAVNQELLWSSYQTAKGRISIVTPKPKRWSEYMRGLGRDIWNGIDTTQYINTLRDEWEGRKTD